MMKEECFCDFCGKDIPIRKDTHEKWRYYQFKLLLEFRPPNNEKDLFIGTKENICGECGVKIQKCIIEKLAELKAKCS